MHVFRLMGLPDKVIAFDSLPNDLLREFELCRADGFPRHWKEWLGKIKRKIQVPPERDPITGQVRTFEPIYEEDHFFYLVDSGRAPIIEAWNTLCAYVRQNVDPSIRLKDDIGEMAVPLAATKTDGVTLEPDEVPVIKLNQREIVDVLRKKPEFSSVKCDEKGCSVEFKGSYAKNALRLHKMSKHIKQEVKQEVTA